jgi:hypothetical protein
MNVILYSIEFLSINKNIYILNKLGMIETSTIKSLIMNFGFLSTIRLQTNVHMVIVVFTYEK